jgi:hypothetical protein
MQAAAAQKPNSSFQSSHQPLKRCKSNASQAAVPKQAEAPKGKKLTKLKTMIPHQNKGSGIPPVKDPENPEVEQLQVFVDEEESETEEQTAAEDVLQEFQAA